MCNGLDLVGGGQNKRLKARFQFKQILYNFARLFFFFTVYMSHSPDGDQGFTFKTPAAYYFITIKFSLVIDCTFVKCPWRFFPCVHCMFNALNACAGLPEDSENCSWKLIWLITVSLLWLCAFLESVNYKFNLSLLEIFPSFKGDPAYILFCYQIRVTERGLINKSKLI